MIRYSLPILIAQLMPRPLEREWCSPYSPTVFRQGRFAASGTLKPSRKGDKTGGTKDRLLKVGGTPELLISWVSIPDITNAER